MSAPTMLMGSPSSSIHRPSKHGNIMSLTSNHTLPSVWPTHPSRRPALPFDTGTRDRGGRNPEWLPEYMLRAQVRAAFAHGPSFAVWVSSAVVSSCTSKATTGRGESISLANAGSSVSDIWASANACMSNLSGSAEPSSKEASGDWHNTAGDELERFKTKGGGGSKTSMKVFFTLKAETCKALPENGDDVSVTGDRCKKLHTASISDGPVDELLLLCVGALSSASVGATSCCWSFSWSLTIGNKGCSICSSASSLAVLARALRAAFFWARLIGLHHSSSSWTAIGSGCSTQWA
mmetsp:Transcript_65865/g.122923  ORF Transcript_65865/g.122923 Transcript_65865/m.122923 type:complete len:293 (-) Transcript_65865:406-1284(-)